ncbi:MAG TPA: hypothetical protein VL947_00370, partial [Cytophagales bacterium]|nr:hypothetical protein [Cytophagales bacterium]
MKYKLLFLSLFSFLEGFSQIELWTGAGFDFGVPISGYEHKKSILKPGFHKAFNENLYLQIRFFKRLGLEGYVAQNTQLYRYKDQTFYHATGNKYDAIIKSNNNFVSWGANLIYRQPIIGSYAGIYLSAGYRVNNTGNASVSETKKFQLNSQEFN